MNRTGARSATTPTCAFIVALLCLALLPTSAAEHDQVEPNRIPFEFDQEQGITMSGTVSISGVSHHPLRNASWYLFDVTESDNPMAQGDYLTTVIPSPDGFLWNLSFDGSSYDCTCVIEVHVPSSKNPVHVHSHSFFIYIGEDNHIPILKHADFDFISIQGFNGSGSDVEADEVLEQVSQLSGEQTLTALDNTNLEFLMMNPMGVTNDPVLKANVCQAPFGICIEDPVMTTLDSQLENGVIVLSLNSSLVNEQEGIWKFSIFAQDSLLRASDSITMMFIHDTTPPEVRINMDSNAYERQLISVFSEGNDGYTGSSVSETWSLTLPNGSVRAPLDSEIVDSGHLVFNLSLSGIYALELTLRDKAGYTNSTSRSFSVINEIPKAIVTVDGLTTVYGQEIRMTEGGNWTIVGIQSTDNEAIDYLWIIEESTSIRGVDKLESTDFSSTGTFSVELIVFDDDGATNSTLITLVITDESDTVSSGENKILLAFSGLLLLGITIACLVNWLNRKPSSSLPKWSTTNPSIAPEELTEHIDENATIEEASAGG